MTLYSHTARKPSDLLAPALLRGFARAGNKQPMTVPHCIERFQERYGRELSIDELRAMEERCRAGEGLLKRRTNYSHHGLLVGGMAVIAVFASDKIATFLPRANATTKGMVAHVLRGPSKAKRGRRPKSARKRWG